MGEHFKLCILCGLRYTSKSFHVCFLISCVYLCPTLCFYVAVVLCLFAVKFNLSTSFALMVAGIVVTFAAILLDIPLWHRAVFLTSAVVAVLGGEKRDWRRRIKERKRSVVCQLYPH